MSAVAEFAVQKFWAIPGYSIRLLDAHDLFACYCVVNGVRRLCLVEFKAELIRLGYLIGRGPDNVDYIANISLAPVEARSAITRNEKGQLKC